MAGKRIFVSFAIEDRNLRDFLKGQALHSSKPYEYTDYSVKEAWSSSWKTQCRARIRQCSGMIGIITPNTHTADGQIWELKCAVEEQVPLLLIKSQSAVGDPIVPLFLSGKRVRMWKRETIRQFIEAL